VHPSLLYKKTNIKFCKKAKINDLINLIAKATDKVWQLNATHIFTAYPITKDFFIKRKDILKIKEYRIHEIWLKAIEPTCYSFDKKRLLYIANLLKREVPWDQVINKCQYFYANYFGVVGLNEVENNLIEEFGNINSKIKAKKIIAEETRRHKKIIKKYKDWFKDLNGQEKKFVKYIQYLIEYRDNRKMEFNKGFVVMWRAAEEISERVGIRKSIIPFIKVDEFLKGQEYLKENINNFQKRLNGACLFIDHNGEYKIEYVDYSKIEKTINNIYTRYKKITITKNNIIKGNIGSFGKTVGVIRKIIQFDKKAKFNKGEILVTGMTRPEFILFMKKASAIITDEGGITCHAAIISRELGIPCVIGTKIATQVLKDGDLVEVDADKGVVKILKN